MTQSTALVYSTKDVWNVKSNFNDMEMHSCQWKCCSLINENMENYSKNVNTLVLSYNEAKPFHKPDNDVVEKWQ